MKEDESQGLRLPDLSIRNFRGIRRLSIRRLGRVNLLAGRNGVGKTTVLEAVRVYASKGSEEALSQVLRKCHEFASILDQDSEALIVPDFAALFYGRSADSDREISVGPQSGHRHLRIQMITPEGLSRKQRAAIPDYSKKETELFLKVAFDGVESLTPLIAISNGQYSPWPVRRAYRSVRRFGFSDADATVNHETCESLGPGLPSNATLANYWDKAVLTDVEISTIKNLGLINDSVERIAAVAVEGARFASNSRYFVVKLRDTPRLVPLQSLGDGIVRLFALALAVASSRDGFLIIDEVENGIHHSVQQGLWEMIIQAARKHNVQVLATTHSIDCVKGFGLAAKALNETDARLVRIDRTESVMRSVEYSAEDIQVAAEQSIEVR